MDDLMLLMDEGEAAVLAAYTQTGDLYIRNKTLTQEEREQAIQALELPMAVLLGMRSLEGGQVALAGLRSGMITREVLLQQLDPKTCPCRSPQAGAQFISQAAAQFVRAEYIAQASILARSATVSCGPRAPSCWA